MTLQPEEVSWAIQKEIDQYIDQVSTESIGYVIQLGDGIARVFGLDDVMVAELVEFCNGTIGMVINLEKESVGIVLFGSQDGITEQSLVKRTGKTAHVPVGDGLLGRVVNPLGQPLDNKGVILEQEFRPIESPAPGVVDRSPVNEPLQTGIKAIDAMIPIGKGQRELIIGDRQTGKTTIILDTIINQKNKDVHCFYVSIGQKSSTVSRIVSILEEHGAMEYTTVIVASSSDSAGLQYVAPYAATAMAEHYMYNGKHAVCFYDDLSKHAQAYRQLSLLLRRPPGREAYPGDIFYLHSRLLERSAKLNDQLGGGSLTGIPVIETQGNDVTTYIPTNVISITDGQIYLESDLFNAGIRPGINIGISASRVGGKAQIPAMKKVAGSLRLNLAQFRELAAFTQFGSELDEATQKQLRRGHVMVEVLKQNKFTPLPVQHEVMIIFAGVQGYLDDIPLEKIKDFEHQFFEFMYAHYHKVPTNIANTKQLSDETAQLLHEGIKKFKPLFESSEV